MASIGFNYRMTKVQCAVGVAQLKKIDRVIAARQEKMLKMNDLLSGVDGVILPSGHGDGHGSHLYVLRLDTDRVGFSRDALRAHLKDKYGVGTVIHYPAVWSWEAFGQIGYSEERADCPVAAKACRQVMSLPIFPRTKDDDLQYIAWALTRSLSDLKRE